MTEKNVPAAYGAVIAPDCGLRDRCGEDSSNVVSITLVLTRLLCWPTLIMGKNETDRRS